jgi:hypothetical protein
VLSAAAAAAVEGKDEDGGGADAEAILCFLRAGQLGICWLVAAQGFVT